MLLLTKTYTYNDLEYKTPDRTTTTSVINLQQESSTSYTPGDNGMIKPRECVVLVSSVQDVIKFYTEKLAFDIVDLDVENEELQVVRLRKGKFLITFKRPSITESVEFSFIKGCPTRGLTISIEVTKDLNKLLTRYEKKELPLSIMSKDDNDQVTSFTIKDPFGLRLNFFQGEIPLVASSNKIDPIIESAVERTKSKTVKVATGSSDKALNKTVERLQSYGIVRRAAKKFCKSKIKALSKR